MKPDPTEQKTWTWPYPRSWGQVFTAILTGLVSLLALSYLLDFLKGLLP